MLSSTAASSAQVPPKLLSLLKDKAGIALALSEPAARCVQREDTSHAAFHGCIDWHSAVHGTWSLVAYTAMTGDKRYESVINSILSQENLSLEQQWLVDNPSFELPYGRAWFLRLAVEHGRYYRTDALRPMADLVAASLLTHYASHRPNPRSEEYQNSAWALLNLLEFYQFAGLEPQQQQTKALIREAFLTSKPSCDSANDLPGFMGVCTNWAWAASKVMERAEFSKWVARFLPESRLPKPVAKPHTAHEYGLNFSRAWGLWEIYSVSGNTLYANAYADHVQTTWQDRTHWDGDYRAVGHWVAQFGMFAIQPLFGPQFR